MSTDADKMGTLRHQLSTLDELFKEVAIQYEAAAATLREGLLPDRTPGFQLDAARKVFTDTLSVLSDVGDTYGLAPVSQNASLPSALSYLNTVLEAKEELERQKKILSDAHLMLVDAQLITHNQDAEVLDPLKQAIAEIEENLDDKDLEAAHLLIEGNHPISKLIAYISHRDSLSDDEYDSFRDEIEEAFGRSILRDTDRGRITLASVGDLEAALPLEEDHITDLPLEEDQEETQNEIIDIVDESEPEFEPPMINGSEYDTHDEVEETESIEEGDEHDAEIIEETEFYDETMTDEHEPFWPPSIEAEEPEQVDDSLNGEFEIDEDFNPEEDTITGRLS